MRRKIFPRQVLFAVKHLVFFNLFIYIFIFKVLKSLINIIFKGKLQQQSLGRRLDFGSEEAAKYAFEYYANHPKVFICYKKNQ